MLDCLHDPKKMITLPHYKTATVIHRIAFKTALRGYPTVQLYDCIFYIRKNWIYYDAIHNFSVWLRTGSYPADIHTFWANWLWSWNRTEKEEKWRYEKCFLSDVLLWSHVILSVSPLESDAATLKLGSLRYGSHCNVKLFLWFLSQLFFSCYSVYWSFT